jgi:hypothetical protein
VLIVAFTLNGAYAQEQSPAKKPKGSNQSIAPLAASSVIGSGTPGQITKWTGVSGSNTYTIGDSNITEDKFGKVGIGTTTPTSLLTVAGMIETTMGGYKFPDGTLQTTAGISFVTHDATLAGLGTAASPLGISFGGVQTVHLANGAVTAPKIANGTVVRSLNGLFDNLTLAAGANITITPSGNTLTIAAANALAGVAHDTTLQGNGTLASPLGVAVPLTLSGSLANQNAIIKATNTGGGPGIRGVGVSVSGFALGVPVGVSGESSTGTGVYGSSAQLAGVVGESGSDNTDIAGVLGTCVDCIGVQGRSSYGTGVRGDGVVGVRGRGIAGGDGNGGDGMAAFGGPGTGSNSGGVGIFAVAGSGVNGASDGLAGEFVGSVDVSGTLTKTMGTFKIDHPLDPENKYLYHSFVESPDMMNIYNGNITTDQNGEAVVEMPNYFDALNKDFRYQLTVIGQFAQAIVASEMKDNRFMIKTNAASVKVSWQVTGVRHDAYADKHRVKVEEDKSERERGHYLHPEVFNQPEEKSIEWARRPEMMQKLKQQRLEAEEKLKQRNHDDR